MNFRARVKLGCLLGLLLGQREKARAWFRPKNRAPSNSNVCLSSGHESLGPTKMILQKESGAVISLVSSKLSKIYFNGRDVLCLVSPWANMIEFSCKGSEGRQIERGAAMYTSIWGRYEALFGRNCGSCQSQAIHQSGHKINIIRVGLLYKKMSKEYYDEKKKLQKLIRFS